MTLFQLLSLVPLSILTAISLTNAIRRRGRLRISLMWLTLWLGAATLVLFPQLAMGAARIVGIGRGADLVFYCNVLATFSGFFYFYLRQRALQQQITVVVRELAIAQAAAPELRET